MPPSLHPIALPLTDGENNQVALDVAYRVRGDQLLATLDAIRAAHGAEVRLLPLSGISSGGGVLQCSPPANATVVGLQFPAIAAPRISHAATEVDIARVAPDEIIIRRAGNCIYAGSGITLQQLNRALTDALGAPFKVLGADLTSYRYAQVGATFMTGGMGPQRRYFSDSVSAIALCDGGSIRRVAGRPLAAYAGSHGWTGLVSAVCCRYHQLPDNEFALALPVNNTGADLARLLQHLAPRCYLDTRANRVHTLRGGSTIVAGIEHITVSSMQPFLQSGRNAIVARAQQLADNCAAANADGLVFINAYSDQPLHSFLASLLDDEAAARPTIAAIDPDCAAVFGDPAQMRALREGVPYAARTRVPPGGHALKSHTDATIQINRHRVAQTVREIWRVNEDYASEINNYLAGNSRVRGDLLVYGHLNPVGINPHNRITLACEDAAALQQARQFIRQQNAAFYQSLNSICARSDSVFIGGEKGAAADADILAAFRSPAEVPPRLRKRLSLQRQQIAASSPLFSWRARAPFAPSGHAVTCSSRASHNK